MSEHNELHQDLDFSTLQGSDEYALYFQLLSKAFSTLLQFYRAQSDQGENYEATQVEHFLGRFLSTVEVLRLKYTYSPTHQRPLWVDLSESGYPNSSELEALEIDLQRREESFRVLQEDDSLKQKMLDHLFRVRADSPQLLEELSERLYFEALDADKLFLPYSPGEIRLLERTEEYRTYVFSWGCYDFTTNRPYIHIMTFDQDIEEDLLEVPFESEVHFSHMMRSLGSRAPDIGMLAIAIDDAMESIHPKIIKRICVGPLYSYLLLHERAANPEDMRENVLSELMSQWARTLGDFVLFFEDEIVFSKRQEIVRSLFVPGGKVREIFFFEDTDPECYRRRASLLHRYALLPHRLYQHIGQEASERIPHFNDTRRITFDREGQIHGAKRLRNSD